jgi:hypothetical protein
MLGDAARWEADEGLGTVENDLGSLGDLLEIAVADGLALLCCLREVLTGGKAQREWAEMLARSRPVRDLVIVDFEIGVVKLH